MYTFEYVFDGPNDHSYGSSCPPSGNGNGSTLEECEDNVSNDRVYFYDGVYIPYRQDWRGRSADLNVMFFNPYSEYLPWADSDVSFSNASFNAARSWPVPGETGYSRTRNLTGFHYNYWLDDKGFTGDMPKPYADNVTDGPNGIVDQWDSYIRVTFTSASSVTCEKVTHDPKAYYWNNKNSHELRGVNPEVKTATAEECNLATAGLPAATLAQNAANWYQYFRRRTHVARAGIGRVVSEIPEFRYGMGHINQTNANHPIPDETIKDYEANNRKLMDVLYSTDRRQNGTPLRYGLKWVGDYYEGDHSGLPSPIIESCQKNFSLLFSDGFWNGSTPGGFGDVDKDGDRISNSSTTLADVARYYYNKDLSPSIENSVPTDAFDTAAWQHMVTYTISFGVKGALVDTSGDGWPNPPLKVSDDWTKSGVSDLDKVDDLWHAAFNSRGAYFAVENPQELVDSISKAVADIGNRYGGAASAAANSGSISSNSKIFQAKFDTVDWHGELLAFPVTAGGTIDGAAVWNAADELNKATPADRDIYTWNEGSSKGAEFKWSSLTDAQKAYLNMSPDGATDSAGQERLDYLRGSKAKEEKKGGPYRDRAYILGDIVNSDPVYVGYPPFFYSFDNYHKFYAAQQNRTGMIYFGANDGMFHAIREQDGKELFSYVPNKVYPKLSKLTDPYYTHEFYVDGQPEYGDVQINNTWTSIVASGLRSGGQALFALDITNPDSFDATDVLWEFTDEVDADLGYTFSQPQIKRMSNDKWAVIMGNGLNNTEADGHASTTGAGALFIIFIENGLNGWQSGDWVKLTVPGGSTSNPNALFTPAAADIDGDNRVDTIYAGDRNGKMWEFDVSSDAPGSWGIANSGNPFFDAGTGHPITDRPVIAAHPMGRHLGELVIFGTGQFIENIDNTTENQPVQTLYALWDLSPDLVQDGFRSYAYDKGDLSKTTFKVDSGVRVIDQGSEVTWLTQDGDPYQRGWYIDLPDQGERINRRPILRDDHVFFVSMIPDDDPCSAGGSGWVMVMDTGTGLSPNFPVFDINSDSDVTDEGDLIDPDSDTPIVPVGMKVGSIPNLPAFIYDDRPGFTPDAADFPPIPNAERGCGVGNARAYTFTTQANGSIMAVETATEFLSCGRQNWMSEE